MTGRKLIAFLAVAAAALAFCASASAQFKEQAFRQQYNDDKPAGKDTADVVFSFKEYFGALGHKNEMKIGNSFAGSLIFIGGQQIYNKTYWKLPIIYTAIGGGIGAGFAYKATSHPNRAMACFIGAGVAYWATLLDGVICYKPSPYPHAGKATLYSILLPGLGQIYNKEYWKLPIYLGGMMAAGYFYADNNLNFRRFKGIYAEAMQPGYTGPITKDQAKYYRDVYRRYRDYSILALAAVYLLQIIDANVFSYMHDFEVDDDLAVEITPAVLMPDNQIVMNTASSPAFGLRLGFTF